LACFGTFPLVRPRHPAELERLRNCLKAELLERMTPPVGIARAGLSR
jgi:hypothetical protein